MESRHAASATPPAFWRRKHDARTAARAPLYVNSTNGGDSARFSVASADSISNISARAPRSGKAATLPTHQVESRHVGCATPGAFRHRKHAHERRALARVYSAFMPAHQRLLASPLRMKRSGAELPLCTWSGCGGRLNGVAVATVKRDGGGDAPHCALSGCSSINGKACWLQQCCRVHWARPNLHC